MTTTTTTTTTSSSFYSFNVTDMDNDSRVMSAEQYAEIEASRKIFETAVGIGKYYLWILFALGFPGNCAAIVTIFRMRPMGTFPVFVVMLAVMDTLALLVKLLHYQLIGHQLDMGDAGCSLLRFLGSWTSAYCSWILVFMALERYAAVRFPLKMSIHGGCNAHKVVSVLVVVGIIVALIYMPLLWTSETVTSPNLQCQFKEEYADLMNHAYHWVLGAVYAFFPFCLLTVVNFLIARQIRVSFTVRKDVRNMQLLPQSGQASSDVLIQRQRPCPEVRANVKQVNVMLLSATVVFVILTFPICIYLVVDVYWQTDPGYTTSAAVKFLCQQLAFLLVDSTHAVNFYLYFLSARRFRQQFLSPLACWSGCKCNPKTACRKPSCSKQSWAATDQSEVDRL